MTDLENKDLNGGQPESEQPQAGHAPNVPHLTLEPDPEPDPVPNPEGSHIPGSAAEPFHMPDPPHAPEPPKDETGYQPPQYTAPPAGQQDDAQPGYGQYQPPNYQQSQQPYQQPYYQPPYVVQPPAGYQQKSRLAAGLLAITLGIWGVHNFYLGYIGRGAAQIILTLVVGVLTCGASSLACLIWSFVEGVLLLSGSSSYLCDANGVVLRD